LKKTVISIVAILNKDQMGELYFGIRNNGAGGAVRGGREWYIVEASVI
jgi:hypothetical protein